jgi:tetratricopeptide (TPR) repeat protein
LEILRKGTKGLVFIETICLSSKYFNKSLKQEVEMKDIVYKYKENTYGVSAQKYESAYYDGSANCLSVVNIPSVESILMTLSLKFRNVNVEADSETYRKAFINYDRYFNAVCISAESKNIEEENEINWVEDYEKKMIMTVLKERDIERVYNKFCKNRISDTSVSGRGIVLLFSGYLSSSVLLSKVCQIIINSRYKDTIERDIIKNIKYNPVDKLALEFGKVLFYSKEYNKAITVLKGITEKINSDWRCVYRSFLLLYQIYSVLNKEEDAKRYKNMFLKANPNASVLINN